MSAIQKSVAVEEQQQPSVVEATTPAPAVVESAPAPAVVESAPAPAVVESAPAPVVAAEATPAPVVEEAKPAVEESKPEVAKEEFNGEGVLGYKAPGGFLKKLAGFQKRHFWLGTDAVEVKVLSNYLRGEKPEVGNHNAAWATQTGKGLLFFSKLASDKTPAGIINLADVTDIKEDGTADFLFHVHGQKHVFQATSIAIRDSWVEALKAASGEAKESAETVKASENYKEAHASLTKPVEAPITPKAEEKKEVVTVAPVVPEADPTTTEATDATAVTDVAEPKVETKEEKKSRTKSRSASRKRQSIFGSFNLGGKKSEEVVPKAESKDEVKAESPAEPVVAASDAQVEPAVAVAPATEEPTTTASTEEVRPAAAKRHSSLFDFKSRFGQKKAAAPAPAVPTKGDEETVTSAEAPVIPAVEQSEPLATSIASPATVPTETTSVEPAAAAAATTETKVEATPESKADRRKSSLPFGFGSKKEKTVDGEKPLSPFAKLRQTVKGKKAEHSAEKAEETAEKKSEEKPVEAAPVVAEESKVEKVEEPVVPAPAASSTPVVAASA